MKLCNFVIQCASWFIAESTNLHPSKVKLHIQLHPVDFLSPPRQWSPPIFRPGLHVI